MDQTNWINLNEAPPFEAQSGSHIYQSQNSKSQIPYTVGEGGAELG